MATTTAAYKKVKVKLTATMETMDLPRSWVTDHILGMDNKLSRFLSAR